jgi:hypothetical protein
VSVETIYKAFGAKSGLVRAIYDGGLTGQGPVPACQRSDDPPRPAAGPVVELNRAVAVAQAGDPAVALRAVDRLDLDGYLYFHSTRGELLRRLGRDTEAKAAYRRALELATSTPERRFLTRRLEQL